MKHLLFIGNDEYTTINIQRITLSRRTSNQEVLIHPNDRDYRAYQNHEEIYVDPCSSRIRWNIAMMVDHRHTELVGNPPSYNERMTDHQRNVKRQESHADV